MSIAAPGWIRHRLFPLFALLLLTVAAVFAGLEIGLRLFPNLIPLQVCASDNILGTYYCEPYYVYDKPVRLGYRYKPGLEIEGWWDPADPFLTDVGFETRPSDRSDTFWYEFKTDEMGFPNEEYRWRDRYDVIVTGDSFTLPTAPQSWIELLRQQTGKSILALGASSWSPLNEVEAVKQYGLDKNPHWIILLYFEGNDLINVAQYLERKDSGMDWREYDMQGVSWRRRLITYHLLRYLLTQRNASQAPRRYRYPVTAQTAPGPVETVFKDIHLYPLSADYETLARSEEFAHASQALLELQELATAQGARFLLVYIPSKEHVYWHQIWDSTDVNNVLERTVTVTLSEGDHGKLEWQQQYLSYDTFTANQDDQEQLLSDFAEEHRLEFLDLTPILQQNTVALGEFYHYADPHWNQAGNKLVADVLTQYLMGRQP